MNSVKKMLMIGALVLAALMPALSEAGVRVYVRIRPPAHRVMVAPRAPFASAVWVAGRWHWNGRAHVWVDGYHVKPRKGYVYVPGAWRHARSGWYWVDGHWRRI